MVRFVEEIEKAKTFAKLVHAYFWDEEKQDLEFFGKRLKAQDDIDGRPKSLDMENFEIDSVYSESITFVAGGDWQEGTSVKLCKAFSKNELMRCPFEPRNHMSRTEIKDNLKKLIARAIGEGIG